MPVATALPTEVALNLTFVFLLKCLGLVLAYLTIRLGYSLLTAGVKGEFKFSANLHGAKADLASASPGLLFVLLAIALAMYAIGVKKVTEYEQPSNVGPPPAVHGPPPTDSVPSSNNRANDHMPPTTTT